LRAEPEVTGDNGIRLAHEVRQRYPALPVLLTSGYASGDGASKLQQFASLRLRLLTKPYRMSELAGFVAATLSENWDT